MKKQLEDLWATAVRVSGRVWPHLHPYDRGRRLEAITALVVVAVVVLSGFWVVGQYRYSQDRMWCQNDPGCMQERQDRRSGPWLVFGEGSED